MHRFFIPPERSQFPSFALSDADSRHASQVLRLQPGAPVTLLDGVGGVIDAHIQSVTRRETWVTVSSRKYITRSRIRSVLVLSLLKNKALDFTLEKAVELGVDTLILVDAARSVSRIDAVDIPRKQENWKQSLIEAAKQCGNPWLPDLLGPLPLDAAIQAALALENPRFLTASLLPSASTLSKVLEPIFQTVTTPLTLIVAIGPEGDFTPHEDSLFAAAGALPISLGPLVLRAETAAMTTLAILKDQARRCPDSFLT
ncbi:MAG: 16S rRNA (uracil(1498)-N(3))-methyltransferase [Pedosphaera sp.]|nr:16S rRNA (uracil(1498)-N(3))-methyltransferase [Pedosphaera sp.]